MWKDFLAVREQTLRRVREISESELIDRQHYEWLKGRALWEWIAEESYEHEAEHAANIRNWKDELEGAG